MPKKISPDSPWNATACRHLERLAEANKIVLAGIESETRERKSLEERIDKLTAQVAVLPKGDRDGAKGDQLRQEIKDAKASHYDVDAEISRLRADRDAYHDQIIETIGKARQGIMFEEDADLIPDDPPEPEVPPEAAAGAATGPVGAIQPASAFTFPGSFDYKPNKGGKVTHWQDVQNRAALDCLVESKVGKTFTLDGATGQVLREGALIATVRCVPGLGAGAQAV